MAEIRNPNLFRSDRPRPFGAQRPRRDRRPSRNPRFVPEMLDRRLAPSSLPVLAVEVAPDDSPKPNPLPVPTLPLPPLPPVPPSGPAIPF